MASTCTPQNSAEISIRTDDAINARILAISEDKIAGFHVDPLGEIARQSELDVETVIAHLRAMLRAGTIRRIRQTLLATNLAPGGAHRVVRARRPLAVGFRLPISARPVFWPRRDSHDGRAD